MAMRRMFVPLAAGQATPAVAAMLTPTRRTTRRRRKTTARATPKRRAKATRSASPKRRTAKRPARMVKGSAAAKRHMAKLRKMRKR